ncbi:glucuronosyltransferase [Qipengyuania zhejiangensis]|uniref:glucuronosyltransferase n=1 Tax=Qipengyuania zhejiangensis TaxID=3077782 RepID=UPI002D7734DB|nr:glucuronosyltransferase [Qipengyuania sp. Z2]
MLLAPAFEGAEVTFACTDGGQAERYGLVRFETLDDCNQNEPVKLLRTLWQARRLVRKIAPDVVVSTGAAPGILCLVWARLAGAKTIWIDSIANSEKLSLSGRLAIKFCDSVYTQWEHLACGNRPAYRGSVL